MAMTMQGTVELAAERRTVWKGLNDPDVMRACIPACQAMEKISDTQFVASAKLKIGPITMTIKANILLSNVDEPTGYRIAAEGAGGIAGFAKGAADVVLADAPGVGTRLTYDVKVHLGGKLARFGGRLVDGAAKTAADAFFARFAAVLAGREPPA